MPRIVQALRAMNMRTGVVTNADSRIRMSFFCDFLCDKWCAHTCKVRGSGHHGGPRDHGISVPRACEREGGRREALTEHISRGMRPGAGQTARSSACRRRTRRVGYLPWNIRSCVEVTLRRDYYGAELRAV